MYTYLGMETQTQTFWVALPNQLHSTNIIGNSKAILARQAKLGEALVSANYMQGITCTHARVKQKVKIQKRLLFTTVIKKYSISTKNFQPKNIKAMLGAF